jgi:hypothetical protein
VCELKVELNPGNAQVRTLLDVPDIDFDNQKFQQLRQKLPQLSKLPPRYVVWGNGSSHEMCAGQMMASATT